MRGGLLALLAVLAAGVCVASLEAPRNAYGVIEPTDDEFTSQEPVPTASPASALVDFSTRVRPILESRCMPCHFQGGTMHERLPFDQPGTIRKLGEGLFTRIKDENEQRVIREFLTQQ